VLPLPCLPAPQDTGITLGNQPWSPNNNQYNQNNNINNTQNQTQNTLQNNVAPNTALPPLGTKPPVQPNTAYTVGEGANNDGTRPEVAITGDAIGPNGNPELLGIEPLTNDPVTKPSLDRYAAAGGIGMGFGNVLPRLGYQRAAGGAGNLNIAKIAAEAAAKYGGANSFGDEAIQNITRSLRSQTEGYINGSRTTDVGGGMMLGEDILIGSAPSSDFKTGAATDYEHPEYRYKGGGDPLIDMFNDPGLTIGRDQPILTRGNIGRTGTSRPGADGLYGFLPNIGGYKPAGGGFVPPWKRMGMSREEFMKKQEELMGGLKMGRPIFGGLNREPWYGNLEAGDLREKMEIERERRITDPNMRPNDLPDGTKWVFDKKIGRWTASRKDGKEIYMMPKWDDLDAVMQPQPYDMEGRTLPWSPHPNLDLDDMLGDFNPVDPDMGMGVNDKDSFEAFYGPGTFQPGPGDKFGPKGMPDFDNINWGANGPRGGFPDGFTPDPRVTTWLGPDGRTNVNPNLSPLPPLGGRHDGRQLVKPSMPTTYDDGPQAPRGAPTADPNLIEQGSPEHTAARELARDASLAAAANAPPRLDRHGMPVGGGGMSLPEQQPPVAAQQPPAEVQEPSIEAVNDQGYSIPQEQITELRTTINDFQIQIRELTAAAGGQLSAEQREMLQEQSQLIKEKLFEQAGVTKEEIMEIMEARRNGTPLTTAQERKLEILKKISTLYNQQSRPAQASYPRRRQQYMSSLPPEQRRRLMIREAKSNAKNINSPKMETLGPDMIKKLMELSGDPTSPHREIAEQKLAELLPAMRQGTTNITRAATGLASMLKL